MIRGSWISWQLGRRNSAATLRTLAASRAGQPSANRMAIAMGGELAKTPLHDWHAAHGGRMVDFAGWSMPVQYGSIVDEHNATRNAVTLFDVSHMGRLDFRGDAGTLLDSLVTRRVADMTPGKIRYSLVTNEAGGVLD